MGFKIVLATQEKEEEVRTKIAMIVAMAEVVLVALVGSASTASAQQIWGVIQCDSDPCYATGAHQIVFEQVGNRVADNIYARGGHDKLITVPAMKRAYSEWVSRPCASHDRWAS